MKDHQTIAQDQSGFESFQPNLAQSIGKNTLFGVAAKLTQVSTRFVTVPIVIAHLGLGGYGVWAVVMTIAAYMRFGSVGLKSAFQKYVAEASATGNFDEANRLLSTGCAIMLALSLVGLIPMVFFALPLARAAGVPPEFLSSAAASVSVLAAIMLLSNAGSVFEATVMGVHRIDAVRTFTTVCFVAEALAITVLLHLGYGLFAMASVMAVSEVGFVACCYLASKKLAPQIRLRIQFVTTDVIRELVRFGGTYQLINVLEIIYAAIVPVAVLRHFGADSAGVYAITGRLVTAAMTLSEALLQPVLSGGAMVYASRIPERMAQFVATIFKANLMLNLFPLAFISVFGSRLIYAWTGQSDTTFVVALPLVCIAGGLQSFSLLQVVLYRSAGKAALDNIRQVLRLLTLSAVVLFAGQLGFYGVLLGLMLSELVGVLFMLLPISQTFPSHLAKSLVPNAVRLLTATSLILMAGIASLHIPLPFALQGHGLAALQLAIVCSFCAIAAWPVMRFTGVLCEAEQRYIVNLFLPRRFEKGRRQARKAI